MISKSISKINFCICNRTPPLCPLKVIALDTASGWAYMQEGYRFIIFGGREVRVVECLWKTKTGPPAQAWYMSLETSLRFFIPSVWCKKRLEKLIGEDDMWNLNEYFYSINPNSKIDSWI